MFEVLRECGALARLLPEVDRLWGVPQRPEYHPEIDCGVHLMMVLDLAAQLRAPLAVRFACLGHDLGKGTTPADVLPRHIGHEERSVKLVRALAERLRVPTDCRELAEVVAREHGNVHRSGEFGAAAIVAAARTLRRVSQTAAFRRAAVRVRMRRAWPARATSSRPYPQRARLARALALARAIDTAAGGGTRSRARARRARRRRRRARGACAGALRARRCRQRVSAADVARL